MEQYASIQQLLKKEEGEEKRLPIYPPTVIQAVFDAKTGAPLEAVLAQYNAIYVQYQGTPEATRNIIPKEMRRAGLIITYMNMNSETITERANFATQMDNDHWGLDINWSRIDELSLSGDISVSVNGTWIINGKDTKIAARGPKGDTGLTPWLKTINNKLHFSYDNIEWEQCSENIAAWFRFNATSSDSQNGTIGKVQISRDNKTWTDLSPEIRNYLRIQGYVASTSALPSGQAVGTIFGVGPTYDAADTSQTNPIYTLYVYDGKQWVNNGKFTSIAAGVVQETGDSETQVMSQKATTEKLTELASEVDKNKRTLDLNISESNPYIIEDYQYIEGLFPEGTTILVNTNTNLYYIPTYQGESIRVTVNKAGARTGYTKNIPQLNGEFQGYIEHSTSSSANNTVFESPIDGYFVVGLKKDGTIQFYKENNGLGTRIQKAEEDVLYLSQESKRLDDEIEKTKRELYSNLSEEIKYILPTETINGLIPIDNLIQVNTKQNLYYTRVYKGEKIRGTATNIPYSGFCENIPKLNSPVIDNIAWSNTASFNANVFESPIDGYFCVSCVNTGTIELYKENDDSLVVKVANLENKTSDLDTIREDIYGKTADVSFETIEGSSISYYIQGNFVAGETYIVNVKKGFGTIFTSYLLFGYNGSYINEQSFRTPIAEYVFPEGATSLFFRVSKVTVSDTVEIEVTKKSAIYPTLESIIGTPEYESNLPNYLFAIDNVSGISTPQTVYLEGLLDRNVNVEIDNEAVKYVSPESASGNVNTATDTIHLGDNTHNYNLITTKSSVLEGKLIKHLVIGDSWAAAENLSLKKEDIAPWNYASTIANEIHKLAKDGSLNCKFVPLGTRGYKRKQGEYKGESYELYSNNEGRGGWSGATYLRHPNSVRTEGSGVFSEKVAWDACGLGRKQIYGNTYDESAAYEEYVADISHRNMYLLTAMGYYHWDYTTELLNHCGVSGEYIGTTSQKEAIDTYMENLLNNPTNPFYDRNVAMSSQGQYAFSLAKYIERYKTLEDDGVTRLVKGSTAGTSITYDSQITNYNVCTPTHVTIELGINDYGGLSQEQRASDIEKIAELITAYNSNIKVGFVQVHIPGAFNPKKWSNVGKFDQIDSWSVRNYTQKLWDINRILSEKYNTPNGINGIYYIPTYYVHGFTKSGAYKSSLPSGREIIVDGTDGLHPAIDVYQEIGYQILCWLLYTLV